MALAADQAQPGYSTEYGQPALDIIWPALKNTLVLTITAVVIGKSVAILLGIYSAGQAIFDR